MMRPEEIEELLGAYALDAVDEDERQEIETYLQTNPRARAEVQEYREVASMLAFGGADAPEGVWDRIVAALEEPPPPLQLVRPEAVRAEPARPTRRPRTRWWGPLAIAAALVVAAVLVVRDDDGSVGDLRALAQSAIDDPGARRVELKAPDGSVVTTAVVVDGKGYLFGDSLRRLDPDSTWQLWGVRGGEAISLGVLGSEPSVVAFSTQGPFEALALTVERRGGVPASSQLPAAVGTLA